MIPAEMMLLSTIAEDAASLSAEYGVGLEIDEFCTAANMDAEAFDTWDALVREKLAQAGGAEHAFHAPFAELCPAAIDPLVREVARKRFEQAYAVAKGYGIRRMVVHAGFIPQVYFPVWFVEHSAAFWRDFLADKPGDFCLLIENVLEDDPAMLRDLMEAIDDPRARICLDIGHAHCRSGHALAMWIQTLAPYIGHVHVHNNHGKEDSHGGIQEGSIPVREVVRQIRNKAPGATFALEMARIGNALDMLLNVPDEALEADAARATLKRVFGYDDFRDGQRPLVDAQLNGHDAFGVMPTGAGKSICFQLPALLMEGTALVISPLISLMKDQVTALRQAGVNAAYLNSSLTERQFDLALRNAENGQYQLIYVAPERLMTPRFLSFAKRGGISLVAVDEAHCISQWGQDFRPSYLDIPAFLSELPKRPPVSAFTATATPQVKVDIVRLLGLIQPVQVQTGFDRPNLYYEVQRPKDKRATLLSILERFRGESGIIYCATRKNVEEICDLLRRNGYPATRYHAGLADGERHANQEDFIFDRCPIIVATNAFGMGIDKSNVRFIIHYNMPKDLESYYQEAGRAGRDGERAECILLFSGQDVNTQRHLIQMDDNESMDPATRRRVQENADKRLQDMVQYCHTQNCLRQHILRYFGEPLAEPCGNCGSCASGVEAADLSHVALPILRCIQDTGERFGLGTIMKMLRGAKSKRLEALGLNRHAAYGSLRAMPAEMLDAVGDQLLAENYILVTGGKYPVATLDDRALDALDDGGPVMLRIPAKTPVARLVDDAPMDKVLFEALRALRQRLATQKGVPNYVIFNDATLQDMCRKEPRTREEMLGVKGVGEAKYQQFGEAFLRVIQQCTGGG